MWNVTDCKSKVKENYLPSLETYGQFSIARGGCIKNKFESSLFSKQERCAAVNALARFE